MAVASNPTSTSNTSWLDSFWGGVSSIGGNVANIWLQYRSDKSKAELEKLQANNTALLGKEQLAMFEAQQARSTQLLWGILLIAGVVAVILIKKIIKKV